MEDITNDLVEVDSELLGRVAEKTRYWSLANFVFETSNSEFCLYVIDWVNTHPLMLGLTSPTLNSEDGYHTLTIKRYHSTHKIQADSWFFCYLLAADELPDKVYN